MKWIAQPERQRIEVQVAILGAAYLIASLNAVFGLSVIALMLVRYRNLWVNKLHAALTRFDWLIALGIPLSGFVIIAALRHPIAHDDLLRDIIIGTHYQFSYQNLYPLSSLPTFSLWWGFDHALAWMQQFVSPMATMWIVQAAALVSMTTVIALAAAQTLGDRTDKAYWVGLAVVLALMLSLGRISLGRPEIILSIWAISAVLVRRTAHAIAWTVCGLFLVTSYWLAFLYFVTVTLFHSGARHKIAALFALITFHAAFWLGMFGAEYFQALLWLPEVMKNQIVPVSENIGLELYLSNPYFLALVVATALGLIHRFSTRALPLALTVTFFIAANQVRYIGLIAPLLTLLALECWAEKLPLLSDSKKVLMALLCFFLLVEAAGKIPSMDDAPAFRIPEHSRVITAFGHASYAMPFFNPGIQVEPSYALGAAPREVQQLSLDIQQGNRPDCDVLHKYRFTHVVEKTLSGQPPACLRLTATQHEWRLWSVR